MWWVLLHKGCGEALQVCPRRVQLQSLEMEPRRCSQLKPPLPIPTNTNHQQTEATTKAQLKRCRFSSYVKSSYQVVLKNNSTARFHHCSKERPRLCVTLRLASRARARPCRRHTHSAMLRQPQEAAACRGVQPSLSCWLTLAPFSTRNFTMSRFSSMQACKEKPITDSASTCGDCAAVSANKACPAPAS